MYKELFRVEMETQGKTGEELLKELKILHNEWFGDYEIEDFRKAIKTGAIEIEKNAVIVLIDGVL